MITGAVSVLLRNALSAVAAGRRTGMKAPQQVKPKGASWQEKKRKNK